MALRCVSGGKECDGCGECFDDTLYCDYCGKDFLKGDKYYDINGDIYCKECFEKMKSEWEREA